MELDTRLQPHLGRLSQNYKPGSNITQMAIAKVTKVHHKQGTVDLQLIKSNNVISSDASNEGKYGARILTTTAHFDPNLMASSGVIEPIQEGQLVLVAFVDGKKNQPVVIGSFHQTWDTDQNILPNTYPLEPDESTYDKKEAIKYLRVHPSQFYQRIDGTGGFEMSHPSKTFLQMDSDLYGGDISDEHGGYDHKDLNEIDPVNGQSRFGKEEDVLYPVNFLFVHRSSFEDSDTTWTKFFINSSGLFRVTRDNNDGALSFIEITENGAMTLRRQNDSSAHHSGDNYSELSIGEDGSVSMSQTINGKSSVISMTNGDIMIAHKDGSYIQIDSNGISFSTDESQTTPVLVAASEPINAEDGTVWIDVSDILEV